MLHCFGLLPAESAGWIPIKQAHSTQALSYRGMIHWNLVTFIKEPYCR
jgi:hypothetical protein